MAPGAYNPGRSTLAGAEYSISRALFGPRLLANLAVQYATDFWGIRVNERYYDKDLEFNGIAGCTAYPSNEGLKDYVVIRMGPKAMTSARQLLSTSAHEGVHVEQIANGTWRNDTVGNARNELEAYTRERGLSKGLNLPRGDIDTIDDGIRDWTGVAQ